MSETRAMSGARATTIIMRMSIRRLMRSRVVWASLALLFLPAVSASLARSSPRAVFALAVLLLVVLPPLHLASAIAEEIEDKTFSYLWSRPFPRWSVVAGKLAGVLPLLVLATVMSVLTGMRLAFGIDDPDATSAVLRSMIAMGIGAISCGMIAVGVGSLIPKYSMATSMAYMFVLDLPIGAIPFEVSNLSVTHHVRTIAGIGGNEALLAPILWCIGIGAVWLAVGLVRSTYVEYQA